MINDIAFKHNGNYFDLAIDNSGDLKQDLSFYSAILSSIFVNKRASSDEIPQPERQSGWWGNVFNSNKGYEIGSKLWILKQARNTIDTLNKGIAYIQDGLKWIKEDGYCQNITVSGSRKTNNMEFYITVFVTKNQIEKYTIQLWENTNVLNAS